MKGILTIVIVAILLFTSISSVFARSGCCSWHGGVRADGCGCNDGTPLSSTCAPYYTCTYSTPIQQFTPTTIPPTSTPMPTSAPSSTNTPIPTSTPVPTNTPSNTSNSQKITQEVAGTSTSSNNNFGSIILGLLLLSGLIGGIYFKNKKDKSKSPPDNL